MKSLFFIFILLCIEAQEDGDVCCVLGAYNASEMRNQNCTLPLELWERTIGPCPTPDCTASEPCLVKTYTDTVCAIKGMKNVTVNFTLPCSYPPTSSPWTWAVQARKNRIRISE